MLHMEDSGGKRKPIRERDLSLRHLYMKLTGAEEWSVRLTLRVTFIENAYWPFQNSTELELKHAERLSEIWNIPENTTISTLKTVCLFYCFSCSLNLLLVKKPLLWCFWAQSQWNLTTRMHIHLAVAAVNFEYPTNSSLSQGCLFHLMSSMFINPAGSTFKTDPESNLCC